MAKLDPNRCQAVLWRNYQDHQCKNKGKVEEDGEIWCKTHAPSLVKARRDKSMQRYREDSARRGRAIKGVGWHAAIKALEGGGFTEAAEHLRKVQDNG